jgi:hypothetical protein
MVKIADISKEIAKHLSEYTSFVEEEVEQAKEEVTKNAVTELKNKSPNLTGSYAKGWKRKKVGKEIIIYNGTDYQLTHLLEHGHANRNGGRTEGKAHIRPAEENAVKEYVERVERALQS